MSGRRVESLLLALAVVGFVVPNAFVVAYVAEHGLDAGAYLAAWTATLPSTQLIVDLAIAAIAFFIWAALEGRRLPVRRWWVCIPASLLVGLCFGLPLFLWMRERALSQAAAIAMP